ncbi:MAG: hypothetical protein WC752_04300 [Patescibacteria group bacterium]|jgi:hypothetical protein
MKKILWLALVFFLPLASLSAAETNYKFGFLSAGLDDSNFEYLDEVNAGWLRPHPGPAVWDMIQNEEGAEYDWDFMDETVTNIEDNNIKMLITIWPFADWDQEDRSNASSCEVSENDEFLPNEEATKKGRMEYLPHYRCNPHDWTAYTNWVTAMVERYDGDGVNDMPDLQYPIKHWEIMNEPDLGVSDELTFYKQDEDAYYLLLKRTHDAVAAADSEAKTLIAGAAGGNSQFLGFYRHLFHKHSNAKQYFDIANVHCISSNNIGSFNVRPYKAMLADYGIKKSIWVTEAQAIISDDPEANYLQTKSSTKKALSLGAKKIFYTQYAFTSVNAEQTDDDLTYAINKYKEIIAEND